MWVLVLPREMPSSFGSHLCVSVYATGNVCLYMPQPEKDVCPEKIVKKGKLIYRTKSSSLICVCARGSAGRILHITFHLTQSFFQISLWGRAKTLTSCPRHHDATSVQQPVYVPGCTSEATDLRPFLHGRGRSWPRSQSPWPSCDRDQEGERLQTLNKQEQTGPPGEMRSSSFLKAVCKGSLFLFIYIQNGRGQRLKEESVIREWLETNKYSALESKQAKTRCFLLCG